MKKDCATYQESLAALAEGKHEPAALAHTEGCPRCAERLSQLRMMLSLAALPAYNAPADLINRVKGLMPSRRRSFVAGLLRSSLALSGARSLPETAQLLVGDEANPIRLMVRREGNGYEMMGELPSADWSVTATGTVEQTGARFRILSADAASTGFVAESDEVTMRIPALEELLSGGIGHVG